MNLWISYCDPGLWMCPLQQRPLDLVLNGLFDSSQSTEMQKAGMKIGMVTMRMELMLKMKMSETDVVIAMKATKRLLI